MPRKALVRADTPADAQRAASRIADAVLDFVGDIPQSTVRKSRAPADAARRVAAEAARKAAGVAGALALPPGPLGWLTILPELRAVWRIQAQMVADIAALHGGKAALTREQMLYCLFRHTLSQGVRDLVVRAGERWLVKRASRAALVAIAQRIGARITQGGLTRGISRLMPVLGALGVAAYAYYDTARVAQAAIDLFSADIDVEAEVIDA